MKHFIAAIAVALASIAPAAAQDWPQRTVRVIVPFAPGSTPDIFARVVADRLSRDTKQPFVVENKPGAGGMIGTDAIAKAAPDGHTFGVSITGPLVNNTLLYRSMPYDPAKDLAPITLGVNQPCVLVAHRDFAGDDLQSAVATLRESPGKYNYASLGNGTMAHLSMELVGAMSGTRVVNVPFPGSGQAIASLLSGDVHLGCMPAGAVMGHVKGGRLKALGVASRERTPLLPGMPTLAEQGLKGFEANAWIGVVAPAATPPAVRERMHAAIVRAMRHPQVQDSLQAKLMQPVGNTPAEFAAYMKEELERWGPVIRKNDIKLD